jgi:hypothetical protein
MANLRRSPGAFMKRLTRWKLGARTAKWIDDGRVPGASGYSSARWSAIEHALTAVPPRGYGYHDAGLDERVVEFPWALHRLKSRTNPGTPILDAGSVLNHPRILAHCRREGLGPLSIVTLRYEGRADVSDDVRYEFADLRRLPYRDEWFSSVVCLSTIEHVGMDNRIYGDASGASSTPALEATRAMTELRRVTRPGGALLLSAPFGRRDDRGWFRILDGDDIESLTRAPGWRLDRLQIVRATREGWRECPMADAATAGYNESANATHGGTRTAPDWVSAAEAVALVELTAV